MKRDILAVWALVACALPAGCGDDGGSGGGAGATASTAAATTSTTGSGTGAGGAGGGAGGAGGSLADVDPLDGIAPVELVQGGFQFTEGTCWFAETGVLRFTDQPQNRIFEVGADEAVSVWRDPAGTANGLGITPSGELIACEVGSRTVTRSSSPPDRTVIADRFDDKRFNAPNDTIVRSDGTVYFTDPTYGLDLAQKELSFQGVFRIAPGGEVTLVSDAFTQPNGIALSPDEKTLYVTDSEDAQIFTFEVAPDGTTGERRKIIDSHGGPDGMAVDDAGNLYITTEAGVDVFRPDGTPRGNIPVPEQPANCAFGGSDRQTLYISARTSIYKVRLNVPGKP